MKKIITLFLVLISSACIADESVDHSALFEKWKKDFINKADTYGLEKEFLSETFSRVNYDAGIIEKDRNQLTSSTTLDYAVWIQKWLNSDPPRIKTGKQLLNEHAELLAKVEEKYGVNKEVIISLWGVETLYGNITGSYPIIEALATLSYDKRRRKFFTKELVAALKILSEGHVSYEDFKASWAGATGQCQFMPTSFQAYAQDFDGDGKKDIWSNHADIFASIAYYLKKAGWKKGKTIGLLAQSEKNLKKYVSKKESATFFNNIGLRDLEGNAFQGSWKKKLVDMPQKNSPYILAGENYRALMRWNRSSLFAALNILLINGLKKSVE